MGLPLLLGQSEAASPSTSASLDSDTRQGVRIEVRAVLGPNAYGTKHWKAYIANVLEALERGIPCAGDENSPAYAEFDDAYEAHDVIVTDFHSWRGEANPPEPYHREFGQRVHFAVRIISPDQPFSLHSVHAQWHCNLDTIALPESKQLKVNYGPQRVGIDYGDDGAPGTEDDKVYNDNQAGTLPINELRYTGVGAGWEALARDRKAPTPMLQALLDATAYSLTQDKEMTLGVTYSVNASDTGELIGKARNDVTIHAAPMPSEEVLATYASAHSDAVGTGALAQLSWGQLSFYLLGGLVILGVLGSIGYKAVGMFRQSPGI